ncbi:hypothetical protein KA005_27785 [bacterium]|nr:hypothetical protein [bacterium]
MDFMVETLKDAGAMVVKGPLDMAKIVKLRAVLLDSLGECEHLIFHVEEPDHLCFNSFQLLCSTCRTAFRMKKRFSITSDNVKIFKWISGCVGLLKRENCSLINDRCCFRKVSDCSE